MKKLTKIILSALALFLSTNTTNALTFEEAYNNSYRKPFVTLIYASWADGSESCINSFRNTKKKLSSVYSFVELNIASEETKFFNSKFQINPNLPYVIMQREGGKITRYIKKECAMNESCLSSKLKSFIQ